jgi:hypothetical protein
MKCRTVAKELPAYLANELSEQARSRIERHLKHCALCTAELRALERTDRLLGTLDQVEPRRDLVRHVMRHIEREQETIPAFKRFLTSLRERQPQLQRAAAYILLAAGLALMAYNYQARQRPASTSTASTVTPQGSETTEVASPDVDDMRLAKPFVIIRRWIARPLKAVSTNNKTEQEEHRRPLTKELVDELNSGFAETRRDATDDGGICPPEGERVFRPVGTSGTLEQPENE